VLGVTKSVMAEEIPINAGAPEPEITPAMVNAGTYELSTYNRDIEGPEDVVPRIFRAMWRLKEPVCASPDRATGELGKVQEPHKKA
jgi:hypothetical protein